VTVKRVLLYYIILYVLLGVAMGYYLLNYRHWSVTRFLCIFITLVNELIFQRKHMSDTSMVQYYAISSDRGKIIIQTNNRTNLTIILIWFIFSFLYFEPITCRSIGRHVITLALCRIKKSNLLYNMRYYLVNINGA